MTNRHWEAIPAARKQDTQFYGQKGSNSYMYDSYATHVVNTDLEAGIEIGPTYHMPHFHALLTIDHYSYVHAGISWSGSGPPRLRRIKSQSCTHNSHTNRVISSLWTDNKCQVRVVSRETLTHDS